MEHRVRERLRSAEITEGAARSPNRAMLRAVGFGDDDFGKPIVGVANAYSNLTPCNVGLNILADRAMAALRSSGAMPQMFGTITVSDGIAMGTEGMKYSLVSREVIADSIETVCGAQRMDGILRCARDVFCERGYESAAMAEIAARVGVVEGTLYKYFDSKRALLLAVLERWYHEMFGDYTRDLPGIVGARQRLRYLVWRHLRTIRDDPVLCRLMFHEVRAGPDYRGSALHKLNARYSGLVVQVVREGIASGDFRAGLSAALVRDLVYGGIEHRTWNSLHGGAKLDIDAMADEIASLVCEGIAAPPATGSLATDLARLSEVVAQLRRVAGARSRREDDRVKRAAKPRGAART